MAQTYETPADEAGARGDLLGGWSHSPSTLLDWRGQLIASRYALAPAMARQVAAHVCGEGGQC